LVVAAVLDFFPIEGTHKTLREIADIYRRFGHADRIALAEGYHEHQYSVENQGKAIQFLNHFNNLAPSKELPAVKELDVSAVQSTRSGQVVTDFDDDKSLMDEIRDYGALHRTDQSPSLKDLYYRSGYPEIRTWTVSEYRDDVDAVNGTIHWEGFGTAQIGAVTVDKYLLHHSGELLMPLLHIYRPASRSHNLLLWFSTNGKAGPADWPIITKYLDAGYELVSFDFRGLGETRMKYKALSPEDPLLGQLSYDAAYVNPISSVLADYVYNSLLIGRPFVLQMIEDIEIASRFTESHLKPGEIFVAAEGEASALAAAASGIVPGVAFQPTDSPKFPWSAIVEKKEETWPIQYLLPGGGKIYQH
jgi:hypothetical protein